MTTPTPKTTHRTSIYLNFRDQATVASTLIVEGSHALIYDLPAPTPHDVLTTLAGRCRPGEQIHLYTTQKPLIDAARQPGSQLSAALHRRHQTLVHKRGTPQSTIWQRALHLHNTQQLPQNQPNTQALYVAAVTDGQRTFTGALLHGLGTLSLYRHVATHHDLTFATIAAINWAVNRIPDVSTLNVHHTSAPTTRIFLKLPDLIKASDPHATSEAMTAVTSLITERRIQAFVHNPVPPGQPALPLVSCAHRVIGQLLAHD